MDYLPIFLAVRDRPCLVVGGGHVAARKVSLLSQAGASVTVVAPALDPALIEWRDAGRIAHRASAFTPADLEGFVLVIAATDDNAVNREVSALCQARALPVNVVDQPELCSFITPAIIDRSPLLIAVSSGGASPVLSRLLRGRLESLIPAAYGRLARFAAGLRERVRRAMPAGQRRAFWESVLQGRIAELVLAERETEAHAIVDERLRSAARTEAPVGEVYLVGGGPGDPDLLTFRALRLMQQADVVIYDRLVSPAVLELTRRDAERIYAGKKRGDHTLPQAEINRLLLDLAKAGKRVLRLKGGDPFIFGRGGEEIENLTREGIPFQVVPGITAAAGCAAYAGIPLTHRDYAQSCVFVSGHLKDGSINLNWPSLAQPRQTVVFYMGLQAVDAICAKMTEYGLPATTPVALVERGTLSVQKVHIATLATLPERVRTTTIESPTLLIVGEVVKLHHELAWFGARDERRGDSA